MNFTNILLRHRALFMVLALLFGLGLSNASAQVGPLGPPSAPCDNYWIDQNIGGVTVKANWAPPVAPTTDFAPAPSNHYFFPPGVKGMLQSFTVTLPCGITVGPFNFNFEYTICDPCNPGLCLVVRSFYQPGPPCFHEIQVFRTPCPPGLCVPVQ